MFSDEALSAVVEVAARVDFDIIVTHFQQTALHVHLPTFGKRDVPLGVWQALCSWQGGSVAREFEVSVFFVVARLS